MAASSAQFTLPYATAIDGKRYIPGPDITSFASRFGDVFPQPSLISSDLGKTAVYDLPAPSGTANRKVLIIHGLNTPALGMLPLAKEIQSRDSTAHVVLFDLWGHGLSSTPLVAHSPHIFHLQVLQVLSHMQWTKADIIGFSFGGTTAVSFTVHYPQAVQSVTLIAPAGVMPLKGFPEQMQSYILGSDAPTPEAREYVLRWLEGGELVVPEDWEEQHRAGKLVAPALRLWELEEHAGYPHSVFSVFRDGGVFGCEDNFRNLAQMSRVPCLVVLGALDNVAAADQMKELGFKDVHVVGKATHELPRTNKEEIAQQIDAFWLGPTV